MSTDSTPQILDASYVEAVLQDLQTAQHGTYATEAVRDGDDLRAGWILRLPLAVEDDDKVPTGYPKPYPQGYAEALASWRTGSLKDYAAAKRYAVEVAGVIATVGGQNVVVSTARDMRDGMRDTILRILTKSRQDGDALKIFADGVPRAATNDEAAAAITAAGQHVQAAFNVEEGLWPKIDGGTVATEAQIDAAAWPPMPS